MNKVSQSLSKFLAAEIMISVSVSLSYNVRSDYFLSECASFISASQIGSEFGKNARHVELVWPGPGHCIADNLTGVSHSSSNNSHFCPTDHRLHCLQFIP